MLGLADDPALAAPAVFGAVLEILKVSGRLSGLLEFLLGLLQFLFNLADQHSVLGQSQHVIDAVTLAPGHDLFAAESGIAPQNDLHFRPFLANLAHDPLQFPHCSRAGIDVGPSQPGTQQKLATENVQRQITVMSVVAVIEPSFLIAVDWIVGGIRIQYDLQRWLFVRFQKMVHHQTVDRRVITADLFVRILDRSRSGQLQPVQCALSRQRLAPVLFHAPVISFHIFLAHHYRQCGVRPQLIVIVEIFIAQTQSIGPLSDQFLDRELDESRIAIISKTRRESPDDSRPLLHLSQQQPTGVSRDVAAVKVTYHFSIS
jgi:hypothetical protein